MRGAVFGWHVLPSASYARAMKPGMLSPLALLALMGCEPGPLEPTYENIAGIFDSSCSFSSCHGGTRGAGTLNFVAAREAGMLYTELLVSVPACQYDRMPLIDPGHPENSWLYVKVSGEHTADGSLIFTPAPDWDPGVAADPRGGLARSTCPLTEAPAMGEPRVLTFGEIMPEGSSNGLDARRLTALRLWIEAGAPGPDGTPTPSFDAGMRDAPSRDVAVSDVPASDVPASDAPATDVPESDAP